MTKEKIKKLALYVFFGGLTTGVSWASYALFSGVCGLSENLSNIFSWILAVLFAFVTNRTWVFASKEKEKIGILKEFGKFLVSRLMTALIEIGGFPLLMAVGLDFDLFGISGFPAKIAVTIISVILNYILSELFVFRKKKSDEDEK